MVGVKLGTRKMLLAALIICNIIVKTADTGIKPRTFQPEFKPPSHL